VDHFRVDLDPSGSAGSYLGITVAARNGSDFGTAYYGTVTITASSGSGTFTPTVSGNFYDAGGGVWKWVGNVRFFTAGTISITCTGDEGATGTASAVVSHLTGDRLLLLFPGQVYTPGRIIGSCLSPVTPTAVAGAVYPVTMCVVDQYYNVDTSFNSNIVLTFNGNNDIKPSLTQAAVNGCAYYTFHYGNILGSTYIQTTSSNPFLFSTDVWVVNPNQGYMHLVVPASITAGVPFSLTATVSYSQTDPNQIISSSDGMGFRLDRYVAGTPDPATGTWLPNDYFVIGQPHPPQISGTYWADFTYKKAEMIYLRGVQVSSGSLQVAGLNSLPITVYPNQPAALDVTIAPPRIQSQHKTTISVQLLDAYGNHTRTQLYPQFAIAFHQDLGSGYLSLTQSATDYLGIATCEYTGGIINETAQISISIVNTLLGTTVATTTKTVQVSVVQAEPGAIVNYPNPFNPAQNQTTAINYYLTCASDIELRIYDPFGRVVLAKDFSRDATDTVSVNATQSGGSNYLWDGKNGQGRVVANGIYFVKIKARGSDGTQQDFKRRVGVLK
jgi:hypothetical protein